MIASEIKPVGTLSRSLGQLFDRRLVREERRKQKAAAKALREVGLPRRADAPAFEVIEGEKDTKGETPLRKIPPGERAKARKLVEEAGGRAGVAWWKVGVGVAAVAVGIGAIWLIRRRRGRRAA